MGNTVAPCMCRMDAGTAAVTARGRRRPAKSFVTEVPASAAPDAAPPRRLAVTPRKHQRDDVELELEQQQQDENETTRAGPARSRARAGARAGGVSWAGGRVGADADADAVGKRASAAAAVVTVKIVLKRKDAEALVARLNAQSARQRKARMDELKGELFRAGGCGASPTRSPCRDAWKPSLAPIKEN